MKNKLALSVLTAAALAALLLLGVSFRPQESSAGELKTFSSCEELAAYIERNTGLAGWFGSWYYRDAVVPAGAAPAEGVRRLPESVPGAKAAGTDNISVDYSRTNIQVEGVDEADIVKSDGTCLYVVSGDKVSVIAAYPPGQAKVLSEIKFEGQPAELFINKDRLVVFGYSSASPGIFIKVYDLADREKPALKKSAELANSNYVTSRMTGDYVYVIAGTPVNIFNPAEGGCRVDLPRISVDGVPGEVSPERIHYFDYPDHSYQYTRLLALNIQDESPEIVEKTFLTGVSQNIFASESNIYLTNPKTPDYLRLTGEFLDGLASLAPDGIKGEIHKIRDSGESTGSKLQQVEDLLYGYSSGLNYEERAEFESKIREYREKWYRNIDREKNNTTIHKLAVDKEKINYVCGGEVPGQVLNQFSMDEYQGFFRIATTTESSLVFDRPTSRNNIYVLDGGLKITGKLEGLAPRERIYSARFMGGRAYLVTFRQVDPLFVIDLNDPANPKVLGELKIPGYSEYLHPYDESHLIGIGREVAEGPLPGPAEAILPPAPRVEGVKVALFDVSDPAQPRELAKYVVEGGYSDSPALWEHKAVLFSRAKNLLAIPVSISPPFRIMEAPLKRPYIPWQGVYVFNISPDHGIKLKGKVEHPAGGIYGRETAAPVKRSLYIEDTLYTVSDHLVKMNRLEDLKEIKHLVLN